MDTRLKPRAPNDLSSRFVDERITALPKVPDSWECRLDNYYQLDLRMCFITYFRWSFRWGDDAKPTLSSLPVIEQPSRVLLIDVSLNDIYSLDDDTLSPFRQLRALNASLNRITELHGLQVLPTLRFLDLGFNQISGLQDLAYCRKLVELRLNHNCLKSLASLPPLPNLEQLHVDGNEIASLEGLQALSKLRELSARRNRIANITALTTCKAVNSLDLSHNSIHDLEFTVKILTALPLLTVLTAKNNPMSNHPGYQEAVKSMLSRLESLDGVNLMQRDGKLYEDDPYELNPNSEIAKFKRLTREAYLDRMRQAKLTMEESVAVLQRQILGLMENQRELEKTLGRELQNTLSQLDSMDRLSSHNPVSLPPREDLSGQGLSMFGGPGDTRYGPSDLPEDRRNPYTRAWRGSDVKETDQVLRMAALRLGTYQRGGAAGAEGTG
ncbi:hypothetical protein BOX15_Mlig005636g3 [Macrostomum lignano]|uniref:U2A'/phosphoprotein 32 family A C-terminal domain-containing protein n=1 Tax=Macrostomum lignano TaxID=282301 RepID=A0A267H7A8_9PLAT|nr:hypothetical protein BOX15_Mlig005636g3 [Macrostomum lignano]